MTISTSDTIVGDGPEDLIRAEAIKLGFDACRFTPIPDAWPAGAKLAERLAKARENLFTEAGHYVERQHELYAAESGRKLREDVLANQKLTAIDEHELATMQRLVRRMAKRRLVGRDRRDDAGRLRDREVEVRTSDGVRPAQHLRELVGEAGVPDPTVDRTVHFVLAGAELGELLDARLHHLRDAVEHLAAVVGGCRSPLRLRAARRLHRVTHVLARGTRDVLTLRLVGAGTRPRFTACRSS